MRPASLPRLLHLTFGRSVAIVAIFVGFQLAIGAGLGVAIAVGAKIPAPLFLICGNSVAAWLTLAIELRRQGQPWSALWTTRHPALALALPFVALILGNAVLVQFAETVLFRILPQPDSLNNYFATIMDLDAFPISGPLALVAMASITEELIFRGLILRGLLRIVTPRRAILISTALFAAMHLNPWQLPVALMLGWLLGWIFYRTGSVGLCIAGHALHNGLQLIASALLPTDQDPLLAPPEPFLEFPPVWWGVIAVVAVLAGWSAIRRLTPAPPDLRLPPPPPLPPPLPPSFPPEVLASTRPPAESFCPAAVSDQVAPPMSTDLVTLVTSIAQRARAASLVLATTPTNQKNAALEQLAALLPAASDRLIAANREDLAAAEANGLSAAQIDRLTLTPARLEHLAASVREVAALPDPVGTALDTRTRPNGLIIEKRRVPIGVIGIIYEARPNVTIDCAILCLKSGNAAILRGGKEIFHTNTAFAALISEALAAAALPADAVQLIPTTDRAALNTLLKLDELIHCIIPRGGESLIRFVAQNSTIPVIKHYTGVCCLYLDEHADADLAESIVLNAKTQRPGVCNAAEQLLVHAAAAPTLLPRIATALITAGVSLRADDRAAAILASAHLASTPATPDDFKSEFLGLIMAVRIVDSLEDAINQINRDSSGHSESIITTDATAAARFQAAVDSSAVFWNASTRFNDGFEFGFGAEIGISTDRLHARGPMGLPELCSYKYVVTGTGQIRG